MAETRFVEMDHGDVNKRILAREVKADFRRVEAASLKVMTRFTSAESKRLFARFFGNLQLNCYFVSVVGAYRLPYDEVERIEATMRNTLVAVTDELNGAIDRAEGLFKLNGITNLATYDTKPMEVEAGIIASTGRRFLEMLGKVDQIIPLIQTLEIYEVITPREADMEVAAVKRLMRSVAGAARLAATKVTLRIKGIRFAEIDARYGRFEKIGGTSSEGQTILAKAAMAGRDVAGR